MDKYVIYVNGDSTGKEFPYTVAGFCDALETAADYKPPFRLDVVKVVNPEGVDEDLPSGLTFDEREVAEALDLAEWI